MEIRDVLNKVVSCHDLTEDEMVQVMEEIMAGNATPAQIAGLLIALRMKGETLDEITAAVKVLRRLSESVPVDIPDLVDTCGTGGDGLKTFNISTTAAFVVAAAGAHVAKHGNRSVSSVSGSADVLEAAGVNLGIKPEQVAECIEKTGVGFMFAPLHHSAMKHVVGPRREMGVRTLFNILGPLTNPAGAKNQVIGVFDRKWMEPMASVLNRLGSRHVLLVHSEEGLDEVSISGQTFVCELKEGQINTYTVRPESFSMQAQPIEGLVVNTAEESLNIMKGVLSGHLDGAARDIVALNAGAALYVAGKTENWQKGVDEARVLMQSGKPMRVLQSLVELTGSMS